MQQRLLLNGSQGKLIERRMKLEKNKRKAYATKEGQAEAIKRWIEKSPENRAHRNYLNRRSNARGFIRTMATAEIWKS
ncbi:hypothetical protein [Streptococcus alactolyticus]|uniref:hypothetical protein n=1 Tax=Streptococcus alactolyticus TaxID=29389 RepID=UPI003CFEEB2F